MSANPTRAHFEGVFAALRGHYQLHFVDRPRLDRSLAMLTKLRETLAGLPSAIDADLRREAKQTAALWAEEADAIAAAQTAATDVDKQRHAVQQDWQRLRWRMARLHRLYPRAVESLVHAWAALAEDAAAVEAAASAAADALTAGEAAHMRGHAEAQRARALSVRAQADAAGLAQAGVVTAHAALGSLAHAVAGRSPIVVRPAFLAQCIAELKDAHGSMVKAQQAGLDDGAHRHNCAALAEQVAGWQQQHKDVLAKRRQYTADELAHALGEEADAVMDAADALATAEDPRQLGAYLALRMDELHRQLQGIPLLFGHAQHRETLAGLADCLAWLERGPS